MTIPSPGAPRPGTPDPASSRAAASGPRRPVLIGNASGFYGDRLAAAQQQVEGGELDVLTGDYLAELTMYLLHKARLKDPTAGFATTFLTQLETVLGTCLDRGIKIVANAGGLNPSGLAEQIQALAARLGLHVAAAYVDGDDLVPALPGLVAAGHPLTHLDTGRPWAEAGAAAVTANAYLGAWPLVTALQSGADVVVTGRVTDASLVVGPAAWWHGWSTEDWDALAGAVVAGHVIECGAQATGGNYCFFPEVTDRRYPGFPIAEVAADGSAVITKHPDTGGLVSVGTVTAQLLYEIAGPLYAGPDVVTDFASLRLQQEGPDRVRLSGARGGPPSGQVKVCLNLLGGLRNRMEFVLTGLDVEGKAQLALDGLREAYPHPFEHVLVRTDREDAPTNEQASALLRVSVKGDDPKVVGRAFSGAAVELALASYPGFTLTSQPGDATPYGVYWPALVPADEVEHVVVHADGRREVVPHTPAGPALEAVAVVRPEPEDVATRRVPLGTVLGARSGDKGGNANVGFWARTDEAAPWLQAWLTEERFRVLL
ncbi:MAG: hypothetical protein JWP61_54, partial [Friedmanniella sp.]|nr:hypothetical protein [Friedmanniella sp.]